MRYGMYAIRDEAAAAYCPPAIEQYDDIAIRKFRMAIEGDATINFAPADFSLWYLGEYDNESGILYPAQPRLIMRGDDKSGKE